MAIKIKLWCDSGANIHSCREDELLVSDLGYSDVEWRKLTEEDKFEVAREWANDRLDIGCAEIE